MKKYFSRKFIISAAAFLGSIGLAISGLHINNKEIVIIGMVCTILSQAIYSACEAYVDANHTSDNSSDGGNGNG